MEAKDCNTVVSNRGQWRWAEGLNEDVSKQVNEQSTENHGVTGRQGPVNRGNSGYL